MELKRFRWVWLKIIIYFDSLIRGNLFPVFFLFFFFFLSIGGGYFCMSEAAFQILHFQLFFWVCFSKNSHVVLFFNFFLLLFNPFHISLQNKDKKYNKIKTARRTILYFLSSFNIRGKVLWISFLPWQTIQSVVKPQEILPSSDGCHLQCNHSIIGIARVKNKKKNKKNEKKKSWQIQPKL